VSSFSHLLSPLKIGPFQVRNRILVSAHVPGFAVDNKPGQKYIDYHRNYARNGVGLQITGGTPVHESGLLGVSGDGLRNLDDSILPGYQALAEAVHAEGGRMLAQLAHSAGTVLINQPGRASWSASAIRSESTGNISHQMSIAEIHEVIEAYAAGASRVVTGNLDGVEILSAFGFLPQAFLSPLTNHRKDRYGGGLKNRMRFVLELLEAVRGVMGDDRILGIRIPGDEYEPGGLSLEDMKAIARPLAETGMIDYLNVIAHTNITHTGRASHWAPTPAKHGLFVHLAQAIRSVVEIPVFAVGRITDPTQAEQIIADQQADMVGMTRANICDPELVSKLKRGAIKEIRPCVGANTCIANRYLGKPINCMHNASVSLPGSEIVKTSKARRLAVVGAGPAGLEVARIAAERGHQVVVYEASNKLGGQLGLWAASPSMGELGNIIRWRKSELTRLGVEVQLGRLIDESEILSMDVDVLVLATGSVDYCRPVKGEHTLNIVSPHDLLGGESLKASSAIILNEGRGQAGLAAAELLLRQGVAVEIITADIAVAADLDPTNRIAWYKRLGLGNCRFTAGYVIDRAEGKTVQLRNVFDDRIEQRCDIDLIVDWPGCRANDVIPGGLTSGTEVHKIGDCVAPRTVEIAMAEALTIASQI
jgi:2,4-dienoyl-CoA reductase-like NADH-dependent reductase (Old Yellow Enzyme family)